MVDQHRIRDIVLAVVVTLTFVLLYSRTDPTRSVEREAQKEYCRPLDVKYSFENTEAGQPCFDIQQDSWTSILEHFNNLQHFVDSKGLQMTGNIGRREFQVAKYMEVVQRAKASPIVCETGFNGGHSALAFLVGNKESKFYGFDLGSEYSAAEPCAKRL